MNTKKLSDKWSPEIYILAGVLVDNSCILETIASRDRDISADA